MEIKSSLPDLLIEETNPGMWIFIVTLTVAGVDGFLFGYDTGVMNGVLVSINNDLGFELLDCHKQLLTSITSGGALISSIFSAFIADKWGRKSLMCISTIMFTIGALLQAFCSEFVLMVIGRFTVGLGVGAAAMVVPMYIAECSPAKWRGRLIAIDVLCITGGQVIAYILGEVFKESHGWRWMVGLGAVPSIILFLVLPLVPESPRYLVKQGRIIEARLIISKTFPNATQLQIDNKTQIFEESVKYLSKQLTITEQCLILFDNPANFHALAIACGLMATQQFCGFNTLMYYSGIIFQNVGFTNPIAVGIAVPLANFIFTCISITCIDSIGRRKLLVWTMWGMSLGFVMASIGYQLIPKNSSGLIVAHTGSPGTGAILVVISIVIFVSSYALGLGNVPWQSTEFFPMEVRSLATTIVTSFNWGPNIIISSTYLTIMRLITPSGTFGLYAIICFIGWVGVIKYFPECAGLALEEIKEVFMGPESAVKNAQAIRERKRKSLE